MRVYHAALEDMGFLAEVMVKSFRSAFSAFVTEETMNICANEANCRAMLENIFKEGEMNFLVGDTGGMLAWQKVGNSAEIVAVHSVPESWGTGLGHVMLEEALNRIGDRPVYLWAFKENARARRFYEKHGFHWDGSERVSEVDGALEVRYIR